MTMKAMWLELPQVYALQLTVGGCPAVPAHVMVPPTVVGTHGGQGWEPRRLGVEPGDEPHEERHEEEALELDDPAPDEVHRGHRHPVPGDRGAQRNEGLQAGAKTGVIGPDMLPSCLCQVALYPRAGPSLRKTW